MNPPAGMRGGAATHFSMTARYEDCHVFSRTLGCIPRIWRTSANGNTPWSCRRGACAPGNRPRRSTSTRPPLEDRQAITPAR
eukprot:1356867-Pyramimonas_sp.AAC.1